MKKTALAALILLTPVVALAAPKTFTELADNVVSIIDSATGLLILAGIVIYFYGISRNVLKMKDEGGKLMWNYVIWGIGVIFVMVSIWGIIDLLQNTIFGADPFSPSDGSGGGQGFQVNQQFE
ncbi:MAG TPA: hypothetical protein VHD38_00750 [Candidatus Paceibacterota bacterium]|nr:hypothetical protein [Candidatus Paceibacterota bacterium]